MFYVRAARASGCGRLSKRERDKRKRDEPSSRVKPPPKTAVLFTRVARVHEIIDAARCSRPPVTSN